MSRVYRRMIALMGAMLVHGAADCSVMRGLLLLLAGFFTASSAAESAAFGALNLMPGFDARLVEQRVQVRFEYDHYEVETQYLLKSARDGVPVQGSMVFPFLCRATKEQGAVCLQSIDVRVNDQPIAAESLVVRDVGNVAYLLDDSASLQKLAAHVLGKNVKPEVNPNFSLHNVTLRLYQFATPEVTTQPLATESRISIRYVAPYYFHPFNQSGSSIGVFSRDALLYSFAPAAKWAGGKVDLLKITLDASAIYGEVTFASGPRFKLKAGVYEHEEKAVDLSDVDPLIIFFDQRAEKQYKHFLASHTHALRAMQIQSLDETAESIEVLKDGDLKTAWCKPGRTARLQFTLAKPQSDSLCQFEGIAVMSGHAESSQSLRTHGRIKSAAARFTGVERFSQEHKAAVYENKAVLQDTGSTAFWDPYATVRYFAQQNITSNQGRPSLEVVGKEGSAVQLDANEAITVTLAVMDIYPGKTEDVCIAEVLPLLNCP